MNWLILVILSLALGMFLAAGVLSATRVAVYQLSLRRLLADLEQTMSDNGKCDDPDYALLRKAIKFSIANATYFSPLTAALFLVSRAVRSSRSRPVQSAEDAERNEITAEMLDAHLRRVADLLRGQGRGDSRLIHLLKQYLALTFGFMVLSVSSVALLSLAVIVNFSLSPYRLFKSIWKKFSVRRELLLLMRSA